jgi:glucose/arabinose dehydrogenase
MVVGQRGQIWVVRDGVLAGEFLNIDDRVVDNGGSDEYGLLGFAFHPDYANNGRFFVYYTNNDYDQVVAEFNAPSPDDADESSEQETIYLPDDAGNHNGGMIAFGPDGMLYIGTGDGGGGCNSVDPGGPFDEDSLLGKLLRLDVPNVGDYAVPAGNPYGNEVYALGLRNPWRFSFDRANGDIYIGDVGQDAYEEVDYVANGNLAGANFGWPNMEGFECSTETASDCDWPCDTPNNYVEPVWAYGRGEGATVTGGYVYRGVAMPDLVGTYFYADFGYGTVWSFRIGDVEGTQQSVGSLNNPSAFGEDACGEMYVTTHGGGLYRLTLE